jgi:hypothetical protein
MTLLTGDVKAFKLFISDNSISGGRRVGRVAEPRLLWFLNFEAAVQGERFRNRCRAPAATRSLEPDQHTRAETEIRRGFDPPYSRRFDRINLPKLAKPWQNGIAGALPDADVSVWLSATREIGLSAGNAMRCTIVDERTGGRS